MRTSSIIVGFVAAAAVAGLLWADWQHREFIARYSLTYNPEKQECKHGDHHRSGDSVLRDATR